MYAYVIILLFITRTNEEFVDAQSKVFWVRNNKTPFRIKEI